MKIYWAQTELKRKYQLTTDIMFGNVAAAEFLKILKSFFTKIKYSLYVLDCFDVLMSKIIFKK
jgi:hypothetical protein